MTGTEKIIRHIEEQAAAQEAQILGEAREDSARVRDEAEQRVAKLLADGYTAAAQYAEAERDKRRHAEEMQLRRAALGARSELIAEILAEAKEKILAEDAGAYFARLLHLMRQAVQPAAGVIRLNRRDLDRVPADFEAQARALAAAKGGTLVLSLEDAPIDGGFLLEYEGSVENCSFSALFSSHADELKDLVRGIVFAEKRADA